MAKHSPHHPHATTPKAHLKVSTAPTPAHHHKKHHGFGHFLSHIGKGIRWTPSIGQESG